MKKYIFLIICSLLISVGPGNLYAKEYIYMTTGSVYDKYLYVINPETEEVVDKIYTSVPTGNIVGHPSEDYIYITAYNGASVLVIDVAEKKEIANIRTGIFSWGVAINDSGTRLYVANGGDDTISVIDTDSYQAVEEIELSVREPASLIYHQKWIYVIGRGSGSISVVDSLKNQEVRVIPVSEDGKFFDIALNDEGTYAYITDFGRYNYIDDNLVHKVNLSTESVKTIELSGDYAYLGGIELSNDGRFAYVIAFLDDKIWKINTDTLNFENVPVNHPYFAGGYGISKRKANDTLYLTNRLDPALMKLENNQLIEVINTKEAWDVIEKNIVGKGVLSGKITTSKLNGKILPENKNIGIPDIQVLLKKNGRIVQLQRTDSYGDYSFNTVSPGNYVLEAGGDSDYFSQESKEIEILFQQDKVEDMELESVKGGNKWDGNQNEVIDLPDVIHCLQILSGIR